MNIRIALLVIGSLMAGASSTVRADAMKSLDPDQAPIAAVDRFSDKAANIQVRTPDNHLPGPNEPVDFDTGPFITQGLSPSTGKPVRYYNFDVQGTTPAPVYVLYREGEDNSTSSTRCQVTRVTTISGRFGKCRCRKTMLPTRSRTRARCPRPAIRWKKPIRCVTCRWCLTSR